MQIAVIGAGYVGLTTGACLAEMGHDVVCVDKDAEKILRMKKGDIPIYEPGLGEIVRKCSRNGKLRFAQEPTDAAATAEVVFVAVGTPSTQDGDVDLSFIRAAALEIAPVLCDGATVVIKSTVTPGTARMVGTMIAEVAPDLDFSVASNPEFLREGAAITDFRQPDRIVIGTFDERAAKKLRRLYSSFGRRNVPFVMTTPENAELIKYAANSFLAMKICYINDIADLCERIGGDVSEVARGMGLDHRIGASFLNAGPGFGGSCFPKDTRALAAAARRLGSPQPLIEMLISRNEQRMRAIVSKIVGELSRRSRSHGATVAVFGLAFKSDTDDVREAPSIAVIPMLQQAGISVRAHDPRAMVTASRLLQDVEWCDCPYDAAKDADLIVILTEWPSFREIDLDRLAGTMRGHAVLDYRNLFEPSQVVMSGLDYLSVGRAAAERV